MSKLWKSTLAVGPWLTEALGLKATNGAPTLQLLIVPGNPGLGQFYNVFVQELHALFQGTADVMAVSNLGKFVMSCMHGLLCSKQFHHAAVAGP
jgi:hypothetical protein